MNASSDPQGTEHAHETQAAAAAVNLRFAISDHQE